MKTTTDFLTHKRSRKCSLRFRDSHGTGLRLCCWDKEENTNYPEHQICRKAKALNSYTLRRMKIKNVLWVVLNFLRLLRP